MNCKNKNHSCKSCGEKKCGSKHTCHSNDVVRHGCWIDKEYFGIEVPVCSVCEYESSHYEYYAYCPNCGAKMEDVR